MIPQIVSCLLAANSLPVHLSPPVLCISFVSPSLLHWSQIAHLSLISTSSGCPLTYTVEAAALLYRLGEECASCAPCVSDKHESSSVSPPIVPAEMSKAVFFCGCFCSLSTLQEEQHANTSANYDVELLHHRDAHIEFIKSGESHSGHSLVAMPVWFKVPG